MLTSKAQRIFCYNVTCVASKKSCSSRSHLSGCFKCSSLLACKAARGTAFSLFSNSIVLLVYTLHLPSLSPADCFQEIIFVQEGNSHWNKLGFFGHIKLSSDKSSLWAHESTSPDVNQVNGMLTSNAKRIFCDNVTFFRMNVLSNMPLEGLSARVLQCSQLSPYTDADFNSFSNSLAHMQLRSNCVLPTAFKKLCSDKPGSVYWTKAGSKCDAFGTDMRSRMSAPGTSCSKETVLRIEFMMDHHRDY